MVARCFNCRISSPLFLSVAENSHFEFPADPVLCGVLFRVWEYTSTCCPDPLLRRAIIQAWEEAPTPESSSDDDYGGSDDDDRGETGGAESAESAESETPDTEDESDDEPDAKRQRW